MAKTNNISRNLPKVSNTGNTLLNTWLNAATEIIQGLRSRLDKIEDSMDSLKSSANYTQNQDTIENQDYEILENKVTIIANSPAIAHYPSAIAVKQYVDTQISINKTRLYKWDIQNKPFNSLNASSGDRLLIVGNGTFNGHTLNDGDIVEVYINNDGDFDVYKVNNTESLIKGESTTDDLTEGQTNLYFSDSRVLDTALTGISVENFAIAVTDNVLQGIGKAQGQINNLIDRATQNETNISELGVQVNQNENNLNDIQTDLDLAQTAIDSLEMDVANKLNVSDFNAQLLSSLPSTTGTYALKVIDGSITWVAE